MKKIIIIGAGHGGLLTGFLLSKSGYDVSVYEKKKRSQLGYNFIDSFNIKCFLDCGLKLPKKIFSSINIMFFNNNMFYKIMKKNSNVVRMHRKDIYEWLISECNRVGVKIFYSKKVNNIIKDGNKVIGISCENKTIYGDLIIDSSGFNNLNIIENNIDSNDIFNVFRYVYKSSSINEYNVYLKPNNIKGISWFLSDNNYIDILIGCFGNIPNIFNQINYLNARNNLKKIKVNKDNIYYIPVREPLSSIVYNNYVLIGDKACMIEPLSGSGLSICAIASKILYETIIKCKNYSIDELYNYNYNYFKKIGIKLAKLGLYKYYLLNINQKQLINIFKLINKNNIKYGVNLLFDFKFLRNSIKLGYRYIYLNYLFLIMPKKYNEKWINKYNRFFDKIKKETFN